jgi:hypothetical protein
MRSAFFRARSFSIWLLILLLVGGCGSPSPTAEVPNPEYHFGPVKAGKTLSHGFLIKNVGAADLLIDKIDAKSPVTVLQSIKKVPPGKSGKIILAIDTSKSEGLVEGSATLHTNELRRPQLELKMAGVVQPPPIEIKPRAMLITGFMGNAPEQSVTILNKEEKPLTITGTNYHSQRFQAGLQTITPGKEFKLNVKVNPKAVHGLSKEAIFLSTNKTDPDYAQIRLPVDIAILRDVFLVPELVYFGKINLAEIKELGEEAIEVKRKLTQTLKVKRRHIEGTDFQISLIHNIPFIKIEQTPKSGSETYVLEVSLIPEKLVPGKFERFIRVKTNDKQVPELKIPVVGDVS